MLKYLFLLVLSPVMFYGQNHTSEEIALHKEKVEYGLHKLEEYIHQEIDRLHTILERQEAKMAHLKRFKFGRLLSDKEEQLRNQADKIGETKSKIKRQERLLREIPTITSKTFDFQNNPKTLAEYIRKALKNRMYFKLKYLCDPYGEGDGDTRNICFISFAPREFQNEVTYKVFAKSRVIGTPEINGNEAKVDIVIGNNKLESLGLIKRLDKWYLLGF